MTRQRPEAAFQTQVTNLATYYGWRWFHAPDNRPVKTAGGRVRKQAVTPGYPDLTLVRPPELLFVELKAEKGRVSEAQAQWLLELAECGVETHIWRPSDFDVLHARLARGRATTQALYAA